MNQSNPPPARVTLETVFRLRSTRGTIEAEYTVRDDMVDIVNFFPSGAIVDHGAMTLDDFLSEVKHIRDRKFGTTK